MLLTLLRTLGPTQRAVILVGGNFAQLSMGSENTGAHPIVLVNGLLQQRVANEGVAVVLVNGNLRELLGTETLIV